MRFQIGIVGIGKIAQTYFHVLRRIPNVQISFICDIVPEQMKKATDSFPELLAETPRFVSINDALKSDLKPDAVVVATPLSSHFSISAQILTRGWRVLLEKPAVSTLDELAQLYALAEKHQTRYQTMFHFAFAPEVERFVSMRPQLERRFGPIRAFVCDFQDPAVSGSRLTISPRKLGGSYLSSGVNALSVLNRAVDLSRLLVVSHVCRQVPNLIDRNNEKVVPEVDTSSVTEYATKPSQAVDPNSQNANSHPAGLQSPLAGIVRTDWEQRWNFKSTLLVFQNGTVLLDHSAQTVVLDAFSSEFLSPEFHAFKNETTEPDPTTKNASKPEVRERFPLESNSRLTISCAGRYSRQEREYETMFRHHFFHPEEIRLAQKQDFRIHELLLNPTPQD